MLDGMASEALNGLKQSPRLYLTDDVMILLYVDDLRIFSNSRKTKKKGGEVKEKLKRNTGW